MNAAKLKRTGFCQCENTGYIRNNERREAELCKCVEKKCVCGNDNNNLYYDDKSGAFKECVCKQYRRKIRAINKIYSTADIPDAYRWKFIEDFIIQDKSGATVQEAKNLLDIIDDLIGNYADLKKRRGAVLWSLTTGSGKTLAAAIAMNTLIFKYAVPSKFIKLSSDYFGRLKNSYQTHSDERERDIIKDLVGYELLIIDDFGTQRSTDWENEKLYELIDGRNDYRKMTIITSNNDFDNIEIAGQTDRIMSRIMEMCIIYNVKTPNFRKNFLIRK